MRTSASSPSPPPSPSFVPSRRPSRATRHPRIALWLLPNLLQLSSFLLPNLPRTPLAHPTPPLLLLALPSPLVVALSATAATSKTRTPTPSLLLLLLLAWSSPSSSSAASAASFLRPPSSSLSPSSSGFRSAARGPTRNPLLEKAVIAIAGRSRTSTSSRSIHMASQDHLGDAGADGARKNGHNDDDDERTGGGIPAEPLLSSTLSDLGLSPARPLLLGSASFTRKLILREMGVPFAKLVRPIDERALGDRTGGDASGSAPRELVLLLAHAKMDHLCGELAAGRCDGDLPGGVGGGGGTEGWILLTGDQVVTCRGQILEKPESVEEAEHFLGLYGRSPPSTVGSCVIHHHPSGTRVAGVDTATIHFRPTVAAHCPGSDGPDEDGGTSRRVSLIGRLMEAGEPVMSCAGGLMIEHPLVLEHVERIDGTVDSVMGLSKDLVVRLLQELADRLREVPE